MKYFDKSLRMLPLLIRKYYTTLLIGSVHVKQKKKKIIVMRIIKEDQFARKEEKDNKNE